MKPLFYALIPVFLLFACKKDDNVLDSSVQPSGDALSGDFKALTINAISEKTDSVISYNSRYKFIGANEDPLFGITKIGVYLNANMAVTNLNLKKMVYRSASIVLRLDKDRNMGDINASLNYTVYPLDSALSVKRTYYTSNKRLHNKIKGIGGGTIKYSILNSNPVLEIPLDSTYFSDLMKDTLALASNESFQAKYKGFYIQTDLVSGSEGVIHYADLEDGQSGLFLNYTQSGKDSVESFRFAFGGSNAVKFNTVDYNYTNAHNALTAQIMGNNPTTNEVLFVKGMGKISVKIDIQGLDSLLSKNLAINRAELLFKVHPSFPPSNKYTAPTEMALLAIGADGRDTLVYDTKDATDNGRYNGFYDESNKQYVFNIVRHVQAIKAAKTRNRGFRLVMAYPIGEKGNLRDEYMERVVLTGLQGENPPKLNISFIEVN